MSFIGFIPAGAFKTIRSAYQTSTNASSLVAGTSGLLAESRESRRNAAGLEGGLAESTSKLLTLKGEIASAPNLTPVINKVKIQSGFLTSPLRVCSFQGGPAVLREAEVSSCSHASFLRQSGMAGQSLCPGRLINGIQASCCFGTSVENCLSIPCLGIRDMEVLPTPPSQARAFSSKDSLVCQFLYLKDPLNFSMRFLLFLLRCFVIAMEIHFGVS